MQFSGFGPDGHIRQILKEDDKWSIVIPHKSLKLPLTNWRVYEDASGFAVRTTEHAVFFINHAKTPSGTLSSYYNNKSEWKSFDEAFETMLRGLGSAGSSHVLKRKA